MIALNYRDDHVYASQYTNNATDKKQQFGLINADGRVLSLLSPIYRRIDDDSLFNSSYYQASVLRLSDFRTISDQQLFERPAANNSIIVKNDHFKIGMLALIDLKQNYYRVQSLDRIRNQDQFHQFNVANYFKHHQQDYANLSLYQLHAEPVWFSFIHFSDIGQIKTNIDILFSELNLQLITRPRLEELLKQAADDHSKNFIANKSVSYFSQEDVNSISLLLASTDFVDKGDKQQKIMQRLNQEIYQFEADTSVTDRAKEQRIYQQQLAAFQRTHLTIDQLLALTN